MRLVDLEFWAKKLEDPIAVRKLGADRARLEVNGRGISVHLVSANLEVSRLVGWVAVWSLRDGIDPIEPLVARASAELIAATWSDRVVWW